MSEVVAATGAFTTDAGERAHRVASLSFAPRAVIAWWFRSSSDGYGSANDGGIGFWTANGNGCVAWTSQVHDERTVTAHSAWKAAAVGLDGAGRGPAMRADGVAFDGTGFTVPWTTPPEEPWLIRYLALGGNSIQAVAGCEVTAPASGSPLDLAASDSWLLLVSPSQADEPGRIVPGLAAGIGAATSRTAAAVAYAVPDGAPPGTVAGSQRTEAVAVRPEDVGRPPVHATVERASSLVPAVEWSDGARRAIAYLTVVGVRCEVGTTATPARPGRTRIRVGFCPEALLLFTWGLRARGRTERIGRLSLGAATRKATGCIAWDDPNVDRWPGNDVFESNERTVVIRDTRTRSVHAGAHVARMTHRGFILDWDSVDHSRCEIVYVAVGADRRRSPR